MSSPRLDAPGRCALAGDSNVASRVVGAASAPGPKHDDTAGSIRVVDAFVVRYSAERQRSLPLHTDQSQFSLTIAMNGRSGSRASRSSRKRASA